MSKIKPRQIFDANAAILLMGAENSLEFGHHGSVRGMIVRGHVGAAPDATGESYTWWSNRGQAWANNVGWRIDYQIATPGIAAKAKKAAIYKDKRFSDHAPLTIDYDASL